MTPNEKEYQRQKDLICYKMCGASKQCKNVPCNDFEKLAADYYTKKERKRIMDIVKKLTKEEVLEQDIPIGSSALTYEIEGE